ALVRVDVDIRGVSIPQKHWMAMPLLVVQDDRTRAYKKLVDSRRKLDEIQQHLHSSGVASTQDDKTIAYRRLVDSKRKVDEIQQHHHPSGVVLQRLHPRSSPCGDTASSVSGLRWVKDVVLCKRTDFACRMTVVGDSHVGLCEIGIPAEISSQLFVPDHITFYNQHMWNTICNKHLRPRDIFVKRRGVKIIPGYPVELQVGDTLCICREGDGLVSVSITLHNQAMWTSICNMQTQYHDVYVRRKTKLLPLPVELQIGDVLYRPLQDGDLLLVNRPPSVHQHSLIALSARILPTKSVFSINPLCCSPFSGDFDGDCLHAYVPQSVHSKVELTELVHLDKQLLNGQDGRSLIPLSQDSLTAAHLLTGDMVFLSKHEMQQLHMSPSSLLKQPAIIKAPFLTAPLWTGQQLFSSILPKDLYFSVTSKMIHISKGEVLVSPIKSSWLQNSVDGLFSRIAKCYGGKALDCFFLAQEVLSEWISMRGFSVSLGDIYISSNAYDRAKLIQEVDYGMQEAEHASYVKNLLSDPDVVHLLKDYNGRDEIDKILYHKHRILSEQSFAAFKEVLNELQYIVHEYARKDNSMLSMIHAGSKGNLMKLLHQGVCLGLQHSRTFLSFRMPPMFSCAFWNQYKVSDLYGMAQGTADNVERHSSYAVIKSSFLDGLNPFECFLHSLSGRMNLFSENAEFPGTLTRKLMFYMRDLYFAYDGSVRNSYCQQVIQFNYNDAGQTSTQNVHCEREVQAGQPVGALAACAVSEAAYSALDLPSSSVEISPLLKLKNLFECGRKSTVSEWTITLALSKKLRRWDYGFEYAALEVKKHLERVFLSDIVSTVLIFYAGQDVKKGISPWIIHFHLNKESLLKHKLKLKSTEDVLNREYKLTAENLKKPKLHFSSRHCSLDDVHEEQHMENCIMVAAENSEFPVELDDMRETVIPVLLRTIIKGFLEVQRADILWNDHHSPGFCKGSSGLFLKIFLSENCERGKCWSLIQNACMPVMDLIDWECSHPANISDISEAYGVDAAWKYFVGNLKATTSNIGKTIHAEHFHLVADCLSITGEFHPLNAKGIKLQKDQLSITSPFLQGFFSTPGKNFINAAKQETVDQLLGTVDAMAWGKEAPLGTGGPFKLLYSGKVTVVSVFI
ncbi:hypothetical protein Taro_025744, partial [Colocasia esculenta]|nr:hypothetical protein [Colocasia esculenta]